MRKIKNLSILLILLTCSLYVNAQWPSDGLVGYWSFNGNANDESVSDNNGVVTNASLTADRNNVTNSAYYFEDEAKIEFSSSIDLGTQYTICAWINSEMMGFPVTIFNGDNFEVNDNGNGDLEFYYGSSYFYFEMTNDEWVHMAIRRNYNEMTMYINGVLSSTVVKTDLPNETIINSVGGWGDVGGSGLSFWGSFDELLMYNRPLSATEISQNYNDESIVPPAPPTLEVAVWNKLGSKIYNTDGNIGIGTTNPTEKLQVEGSLKLQNSCSFINKVKGLYFGWDTNYGTQFNHGIFSADGTRYSGNITLNSYGNVRINFDSDDNGNNEFTIGNHTTGLSNSLFTIRENGNVGIGCSPNLDYKLCVEGKVKATELIIGNTTLPTDCKIVVEGKIKASDMAIDGNITSSGLNINGNIKTNSLIIGDIELPTNYKLAVDGKIICEELTVKLSENWADFVFESDYKLMSLKDLDAYIKANKHLPEIPTTVEVEENGISVAEMNAKLLQKIEELTLHIIELEKRVSEIEKD